jgi:VWFA-related protein
MQLNSMPQNFSNPQSLPQGRAPGHQPRAERHLRFNCVIGLALALFAAPAAWAQRAPEPPPQASNAPSGGSYSIPVVPHPTLRDRTAAQEAPVATLKVDVQVVDVFFTVKDKRGALVPNLSKSDFRIEEDGKPQTIKYFAAKSDQPLTLGLLLDTSGSQRMVLPMEKQVGAVFLQDVLTAKDLAFLINFDIDVSLLQDFTNDDGRLRSAMDSTEINDGGGSGAIGIAGAGQGTIPVYRPKGTLLYDAIYLASREKLQTESGRKAIILLTDGSDIGSTMTLENAIEAAHRSDVIVYVILIADRVNFSPGVSAMRRLSKETGGRVIDVGNDEKKLREAFSQIGDELRSQYMIGYTPTNTALDGKYRKLKLKAIPDNLKIQARQGYYASKE